MAFFSSEPVESGLVSDGGVIDRLTFRLTLHTAKRIKEWKPLSEKNSRNINKQKILTSSFKCKWLSVL